jgi:hypothetical protein
MQAHKKWAKEVGLGKTASSVSAAGRQAVAAGKAGENGKGRSKKSGSAASAPQLRDPSSQLGEAHRE